MSSALLETSSTNDEEIIARECLVQATIVDWFSQLFIAPANIETLKEYQSDRVMEFLADLGEALGAVDLTKAIADIFRNRSIDDLEHSLSLQYIGLFDGAGGLNSTPPYESYYSNENGRLFQEPYIEMMEILSALDVSIASSCKEPADHLALELAALSEALRQRNPEYVDQMIERLSKWVPQMNASIQQLAGAGLYAKLLELLIIYFSSFQNPMTGENTVKH